jgi:hypothetical protein
VDIPWGEMGGKHKNPIWIAKKRSVGAIIIERAREREREQQHVFYFIICTINNDLLRNILF